MSIDFDKSRNFYEEGRQAIEFGDKKSAIEKFKQSIDIFPHFKTLELLGECLLDDNKPLEALVYLGSAIGLGNSQFKARFLTAKAFLALGEKSEAIEKLKEALEINPDYKSAKELLAQLQEN